MSLQINKYILTLENTHSILHELGNISSRNHPASGDSMSVRPDEADEVKVVQIIFQMMSHGVHFIRVKTSPEIESDMKLNSV